MTMLSHCHNAPIEEARDNKGTLYDVCYKCHKFCTPVEGKGIVNPTFEQIISCLEKIQWSVRHHGCEHYYLYDHNDQPTDLLLLFPKTDGRIQIEKRDTEYSVTFYLKHVVMEILEGGDTVAFSAKDNDSVFILCTNFNKKS